ncbi:methyltransferase-like protein 7A [Rhinatrema bivittatum]|uniref:methyltransferase-like protein 7A n=1 Tax=Rhinatrema bivittatum TaxID=194408 RepID=UPI00112EB65C|nr:methyltransferase-like protein 7A [Rhinatrema bivittatum]
MALLLLTILQVGVGLLALPIHALAFVGLWAPICRRLFPPIMTVVSWYYNKKMREHKKALFGNLGDFARPSGEIALLEIGGGTGANFQFYPPGCKATFVDPNPNFQQYLRKSLAKNGHVECQRFLVAPGEEMCQVATASVDVVVCTLVLCSVHNVDAVLREIKRVLRQGGGFFFLEHVAAHHSSWSCFFQQVYQPTWLHLLSGCHLTRETWKNIEEAKFSELKLRHIDAPLKWNPARPHIIGYAVK